MEDKTILITGGTGSLGYALTEELLKLNPVAIRILSRDEYLQVEMQQHFNNSILRFLIGDIRELDRLKRAFSGVNIVIHTAAMKQVSSCEYNPVEAIRTNIDGSINVIEAAIDCKVEKVLAISSDKAVDPINLYGATKLVMEKLFLQTNEYSGQTKLSCIRFGNFWGSRGSVIPLWQKQAESGMITITDGQMSRYWIKLDEAAQWVIKFINLMNGGEIFIPKMKERSLKEVAEEIAPKVQQQVIGKRNGEKKREYLVSQEEDRQCQQKEDYFVIREHPDCRLTIPCQMW